MNFLFEPELTPKQLDRLRRHQYCVYGKSYLEDYFQPFWNYTVTKMPLWLAPNMITLIGLALNGGSFFLLLFEKLTYGTSNPGTYIYCGVSLFIYQTLDAIDGKQARRTKTAGPLGELFDHGCDSISTIFLAVSIGLSISAHEVEPFCFGAFVVLSCHFFYCSHWVAYVTGALHFGNVDVTEAHVACIFSFFLTAFVGEEVWDMKLLFGYPLRYFAYITIVVALLNASPRYIELSTTKGAGMNGATVANTSIISPIGPVGAVLIIGIQVAYRTELYYNYPLATTLLVAVSVAKVTNRLIVACITKAELTIWDSCLTPLLVMFLNQYWGLWLSEPPLLYASLAFSVLNLLNYLISVYSQIAEHLHINILTIKG